MIGEVSKQLCLYTLKDIVEIVQGIITAIGIVVGGVWAYLLFVRKRQKYPRADITHEITHYLITDDKVLLHVTVTVKNVGDVLLQLVSGVMRIQQILPLLPEITKAVHEGRDPVGKEMTEVAWPEIVSRNTLGKPEEIEIEPGENDFIYYDFIIGTDIQTIEVYSYFKNAKKRKRELGWGRTTIYHLGSQP